jgi:hypothetical protein
MKVLAAVLGLAVVVAAGPGTVVAKKSASGTSAVATVSVVVKQPTGLWVRLVGNVRGGTAVVSCDRGYSTVNDSYFYEKAGTFRLPIVPARADACSVFGGVAGSGSVTVEIRATR